MTSDAERFYCRFRFEKLGKVRFVGHLDMARLIERACRHAKLPLAFSAGYSPHPKISFGLALPLGYESLAEYLDVQFVESIAVAEAARALSASLPVGIRFVEGVLLDIAPVSLQESVGEVDYHIQIPNNSGDELEAAVSAFLGADVVNAARHKKGTRDEKGSVVIENIRPYVKALALDPASSNGGAHDDACELVVSLATLPRTLRPTELVGALLSDSPTDPVRTRNKQLANGQIGLCRVIRTGQRVVRDGLALEPLAASRAWSRAKFRESSTTRTGKDVEREPNNQEHCGTIT